MVAIMPIFGVVPDENLLWLVPACALLVAFTAAFSLVAAALHVYFRDVRYLVSAVIMVAFYATPVIYPLTLVHGILRVLVLANPMTGIVQLARFSVFGTANDVLFGLIATVIWSACLGYLAIRAFERHERIAVDRL
jgi:ABC-type polysaccharide/polyol phosphate export permease